jgi:hypothetical protein
LGFLQIDFVLIKIAESTQQKNLPIGIRKKARILQTSASTNTHFYFCCEDVLIKHLGEEESFII